MSVVPLDCTPKCRSRQHADQVMAALTSGSELQLLAFLTSHCHNAASLRDGFGRTALHLAASLGKKVLLEWLLEHKNADLLGKDKESGWTALHRSAFYGQIHCLISLVKHGGLLSTQDKEGLSVLDLTMKDRPSHVVFKNTDPTEVYTWGNNSNFTLGHGNQESRQHPELMDVFARTGVYIKQVVLCKFHSVFLSQKGRVFTCGHGQGGRHGHGDEQTYLVPRMVEGLMSHHCSQVAAARDHTVVLTEEGYVYTFGLNTFHQLGLVPPPASAQVPKQVYSKTLKGRSVIGVAAGKFHTVLWTRDGVYTMGLNGGQLGYLLDPNGEKGVTAPRQVSALHHKDVTIAMAAASDGATVVVTESGDVYLLADYHCKKIASRQLTIKKVLVSGGCLDHRVEPQMLNEGGGEKVTVLALNGAGNVFCWRSSSGAMRQCRWAYGRQVFMSDIALSKNSMMFVTEDGEGFAGVWTGEYKKYEEKKGEPSSNHASSLFLDVTACGHADVGTVYERIRLEKLLSVHRAVSITMDSKGRNFGVLQVDPKTSLFEVPSVSPSSFFQHFKSLLEEADEMDSIHDVTLQAGNRTFPAHKYILSMKSEFFRKQFMPENCDFDQEEVKRGEDSAGCDMLVLEKLSPDMLEYILHFIYTDSCELLVHGACPRVAGTLMGDHSAVAVYRTLSPATNGECDKTKSKNSKPGKKAKGGRNDKTRTNEGKTNPVLCLQSVAKKLGLSSLSARLDGVKYENGAINVLHKKMGNKSKFYLKKCSYLCDVTLKSVDGKEFPCHKSVLCARLGKNDSSATSCCALEMPTTAEILQVILEYIYTDDSPTIKESTNVEFVCNVLVVADQLLITRLKEICEVVITENLTLKNAAELLEFATMYNAEQLKLSCFQFIVLNLAALLESNSNKYSFQIPAMQRRVITPYPGAPDLSAYKHQDLDSTFSPKQEAEETLLKKAKIKAKKKPRRRSDSSGGYTLSDIIHSPPPAGTLKCAKANSTESLQELLTSDSESSCLGVGSPRDIQSPVFHDRAEVHWTFYRSFKAAQIVIFGLFSKYPLVHSVSTTSIKHPTVPTKLSQKQRKMLAMASKEASVETPVPKVTSAVTPPKGSGKACLRPWVLAAVGSPPPSSMVTFASIVEEEKQQEAALIRSREKPLALIQIEERAIQDLLLHYGANNNPDELIVVERSSRGPMAAPSWNKY
uniref:BTB domain-containing protein n=1 Tax=Gouania willdenowi TaxID=441366 RepID=A0A8C5G593_GOUWI